MVHVLLLILKVLGITLLILLGILILVFLLVLLAPFRYTIDAEYYGDIRAVGRIRWLCFVLDLKGIYGNSRFLYYLKSFGFTISTNDETDKHYQKSSNRSASSEERKKEPEVPVRLVEDDFDSFVKKPSDGGHRTDSGTKETQGEEQESRVLSNENAGETDPIRKMEKDSETGSVQEESGLFQKLHDTVKQAVEWFTTIPMRIHYKISEILSRILDFFANIKENISRLVEKRDVILNRVVSVREFLKQEATGKAWKDSMAYLRRIWKHIRPKRFQGTVHFGMEDPSSTGQILGAMSLLMPLYQDHIVIAPDFEQKILEGQLYARGRVRMGFFLVLILQILLNRNLMQTIQEARTILGGNK